MVRFLGDAIEAASVIAFLSLMTAIELLRAHGEPPARRWLARLTSPAIVAGVVFAVVVARRFYVLAT